MLIQSQSGVLQDLYALKFPRDVSWSSGQLWFVDVFDWDTTIIPGNSTVALTYPVNLCSGFFPCALLVRGGPSSLLVKTRNGSVSCLKAIGCSGLRLESLELECDPELMSDSAFQIQGSLFYVTNSTFMRCLSGSDGALVNLYDQAAAIISDSRIMNMKSLGYGGSISIIGSSLYIHNSQITNCSSIQGGGAIWASSY